MAVGRRFMHRKLPWVGLLACLVFSGCLGPSYDVITATAVARDPMRKAVTQDVELYYPEGRQALARRSLQHLQGCLNVLHKHLVDDGANEAAVVVLHRGEMNNAYVQPGMVGMPMHMVLPVHEGLEMFNLLNFGLLEVPEISCHEAVHYVTFQQTHDFWGGFNWIFGDAVANNAFLEPWFHEGMATYYESRLSPGVGRPASMLWQGMFQSGVAGRDYKLHAGDLNAENRELGAFGAHYLIGNHFIEYLAETYGEAKLWQLIDTQGRSFFSPLGVTLRFRQVYGKDIAGLFNEFVTALPQRVPQRTRPATQTEFKPPQGYWARLASCPAQQVVAVAHQGTDQVPMINVWNADGTERFSRRLTDIFPGRDRVTGSVQGVSGLSFSEDCSRLYFNYSDLGMDTAYVTDLWELDGHDGARLGHWGGMSGVGGAVHPDGKRYVYVQLQDDAARLVVRHLDTGEEVVLPALPGATTLAAPVFSPDGQKLAFAARTPAGFNLFVQQAPNGPYEQLTHDAAFNYAPHWIDAQHLLLTRGEAGRLQAFSYDLAQHTLTPLTDAPYALMDPAPLGDGRVVFLNAQGWEWSVDTVGLAPGSATALQAPAPTPSPDAAAADAAVEAVEAVEIDEDAPYSGADHLGVPTFRAPWILISQSTADPNLFGVTVQAEVQGFDRLGWHGYNLQVGYNQFALLPTVAAAYLNRQLAPWDLSAQFFFQPTESDRTYAGFVTASRPFWTNTLSFNFAFLDTGPNPQIAASPQVAYRLLGPGVSYSYGGAESTPYGGLRRAFAFAAKAQGYPRIWGSTASIGDLSATLVGVAPLPLSERHNLQLTLRGRAVLGAPERVLRTGDVASGNQLFANSLVPASPGQTLGSYRGTLGLSESVRGYEDFGWLANTTASGTLVYTYPLIIDWGWHSLLWLFPPLFIEEVDIQAFASGAYSTVATGRSSWHRAAGAQVILATALGRYFSPTLAYQVAYRFDEIFPRVRHQLTISF